MENAGPEGGLDPTPTGLDRSSRGLDAAPRDGAAYSAAVEIWLAIEGRKLEVEQVGPNFAILRHAQSFWDRTPAYLCIEIDGVLRLDRVLVTNESGGSGGKQIRLVKSL